MKRTREELTYGANRGSIASHHRVLQTTQHNSGPTITYTTGPTILKQEPVLSSAQGVPSNVAYSNPAYTSPTNMTGGAGALSLTKNLAPGVGQIHVVHGPQMRHKVHTGPTPANPTISVSMTPAPLPTPAGAQTQQFQRLKVEDALQYLDQVKWKFGNQPQVYNDFLDIMKEFKSQSIDTPGVITRVSNLFKGHPELIVGFNTFLPPGYKIEVQANDQGYAFQVSVSMPSPTGIIAPPQPSPLSSPPGKLSLQILHGSGPIIHTLPQNNIAAHVPTPTISPAPTVPNTQTQQQPTLYNREINNQGLHHISQAHQQITHSESSNQATQNQPVEFNRAIDCVNKIKNRFQGQPDKYKRFLEILHTYQKEQRNIKDGVPLSGPPNKQLTEAEVYSQVAKLFENQEDLLAEFGQFLPDATTHQPPLGMGITFTPELSAKKGLNTKPYNNSAPAVREREREITHRDHRDRERENASLDRERDRERDKERERERDYHQREKERNSNLSGPKFSHIAPVKRSPSYNSLGQMQHSVTHLVPRVDRDGPSPPKRIKPNARDISLAEAAKYGTLSEYAFFDKVRKALKSQEVYDNFLRCLVLFNQEVISRCELVQVITPFLGKFPELFRWFQDFIGNPQNGSQSSSPIPGRQERANIEHAMEIDLATCKRFGASYCALPDSQEPKKCSGRTALCREVLNDTWVSFPTWAEDSTFVTSRKTQYEEYIYRCEDERFELDVVIECNASTIRVLEGVQKKIARLSPDEAARYRLDDCLGGTSATIHQKAIKRIYGDKAADIIAGLKKTPSIAVPVVLRRLESKDEEWRDAQKGFNKQWREVNDKYYLKSLDHQGINFKQNDMKALRSKNLFNEIETLFDERHEQNEDTISNENVIGPHLIFNYKNKAILDDAANLLIHHVKRQTGIQKQEKARIKHILRHFVPDLFFHPRQQLSDNEREDDDTDERLGTCFELPESIQELSPKGSTAAKTTNCSTVKNKPISIRTNTTDSGSYNLDSLDKLGEACAADSNNADSSNTCSRTPVTDKSIENTAITSKTDSDKAPETNNLDIKEDHKSDIRYHGLTDEFYTVFITNSNWYLFLRLHATLCERLSRMYEQNEKLLNDENAAREMRKSSVAVALNLKPKSILNVDEYYTALLDMVKGVLDGNMDSNTYEDTLREMFGINAYMAFTLDKVVSYAVRQLQHCVTERGAIECVELLLGEQRRGGAGGSIKTAHHRASAEASYQRKAERILHEENCFKMIFYKENCRLTIELLDTENVTLNTTKPTEEWSSYVEGIKHSRKRRGSHKTKGKIRKAVFLARNIRRNRNQQTKSGKTGPPFKSALSPQDTKSHHSGVCSHKAQSPAEIDTALQDTIVKLEQIESGDERPNEMNEFECLEQQLSSKGPPQRMGALDERSGFFVDDNEECQLRLNEYKAVFVTNKDSYLYKRNSLRKARQAHPSVTKKLNSQFHTWLKEWTMKNVTDNQHKLCYDWLMGRGPDTVPNRTRVITNNALNKPPFVSYNRYKVERTDS